MFRLSGSIGKVTLGAAVVLASATFCLVGLIGGRQNASYADRQNAKGLANGAITSIALESTVTPNPVKVGQELTLGGAVTILGGPGRVKFAMDIPKDGGGNYTGNITVMVNENGYYGFQLPPLKVSMDPNTYAFAITATSVDNPDVTATESVSLVVEAP